MKLSSTFIAIMPKLIASITLDISLVMVVVTVSSSSRSKYMFSPASSGGISTSSSS
jgi:hypothetical protein